MMHVTIHKCYHIIHLASFGLFSEKQIPKIIADKSRSSPPQYSLQLLRTHAVATVLFACCFPVARSSKPLLTLSIVIRREASWKRDVKIWSTEQIRDPLLVCGDLRKGPPAQSCSTQSPSIKEMFVLVSGLLFNVQASLL